MARMKKELKPSHRQTRDELIEGLLKAEIIGPQIHSGIPEDSLYRKSLPAIKPLDTTAAVTFDGSEQTAAMFVCKSTGEEILKLSPLARYGCGILYPQQTATELLESEQGDEVTPVHQEASVFGTELSPPPPAESTIENSSDEPDFDVSLTNAHMPSSMAISFVVDKNCENLSLSFSGATYKSFKVNAGTKVYDWWVRKPFSVVIESSTDISRLSANGAQTTGDVPIEYIDFKVLSRPTRIDGQQLVTVAVINRSRTGSHASEHCLFQSELKVTAVSKNGEGCIRPYPEFQADADGKSKHQDNELLSYELLYRNDRTFAIGHGCSADWDCKPAESSETVSTVYSQTIPSYETASITPDIIKQNGNALSVSMAALSELTASESDPGVQQLRDLIAEYQQWIERKEKSIALLPKEQLQNTAKEHIHHCRLCLARMESGLELLMANDSQAAMAREAFRLANLAMLTQQKHAFREARHPELKGGKSVFTTQIQETKAQGQWRAFQIGFLLMSITACINPEDENRDTVDLIWFPTGGGKTEAYLGLAAFTMFYERLSGGDDRSGVQVLMRYTLRLLTTQQFTRASTLICAMEHIRRQHKELGDKPFSIGLWVGGENTPNTRKAAKYDLDELKSGRGENRFLLNKCPWCAAAMGPAPLSGQRRSKKKLTPGYKSTPDGFILSCPDSRCDFSEKLPIYIVDEDIYQEQPSLVIGTVDKFAQLTWRSDTRSLFGIGPEGNRLLAPPSLIIQDELHLISGPLGTMVGLYEPLIEDLCTDKRITVPTRPRIVCSTATIRRYREQCRALYGRSNTFLFPPSGLEAEDSFFAVYAREEESENNDRPSLKAGRKYLGIMAPGLNSLQTLQVRVFTTLLQAARFLPERGEEDKDVPENARDPWWTLLVFYNSLRELGGGLTLFQSDVQDYWKDVQRRYGKDFPFRYLNKIEELTSRLRNDEVPDAIRKLEVTTDSKDEQPVDACIASSIIEVGIDIDRLSLMCIIGQPKTTAQYIQVSGRVGRRWWERPGLVCTLYSSGKPRDRSHYEHFRSYHQKLYAQVEPTSVTPFSEPALERALHSVMAAWSRQYLSDGQSPTPMPEDLLDRLHKVLDARLILATQHPRDKERFEVLWNKRIKEWRTRSPLNWGDFNSSESSLIYPAGKHVEKSISEESWSTMTSMRTVDSECRIKIDNPYLSEDEA